jgi:hypothetical protein
MTPPTLPIQRLAGLLTGLCATCVSLGAVAAPGACPLPSPALQQGPVQLLWQAEPAPARTGTMLALDLQLCPADATLLKVDATMPEHQHGMNYRPSLTRLPNGHWRVDGMLFHMAGRWELRFDVQAAGQNHTLRHSLTLP